MVSILPIFVLDKGKWYTFFMRVLNIPAWYPNGEDKLVGIYHIEYTECLNDNGIDADMLFVYRMRIKKPIEYLKEPKEKIINHGKFACYIYKMLNITSISPKMQLENYIKTMEYGLKRYISLKGKPDVLHAHTLFPTGYAVTLLGLKYHIPTVVTDHSNMLVGFGCQQMDKDTHFGEFTQTYIDEYPKYFDYMKLIFENSYVTSVNQDSLKDALKYAKNISVLPNVVNTDAYSIETKKKKTPFNFISVCAFREGKNLDLAMKATKELHDEGYNIHYYMIGDGFLNDYYHNYQKKIDALDCTTFLGVRNKKEINEAFKTMNCLLMPSSGETFGIPAIESLAAGIPAIISDICTGPKEFITQDCGYFFKDMDLNDLKEKMKEMILNYEDFDASKMRLIAQQFSSKEIAKKALNVYQKAINKQSIK